MFVIFRGAPFLALALLSSSVVRAQDGSAPGEDPPTVSQCAAAYEQAQEQRKAGTLVAARATLHVCTNEVCPDFIRNDCDAWYVAVQAELPTLVFTAQSLGRDLANVRISSGERLLASKIDGQAIELDPGEYDFEFLAPGMRPLTQHLVIARGEQNRLVRVELTPLQSAAIESEQPVVPAPQSSRSFALPAIFLGVGAAGVATFGAMGAWGRSSEFQLEGRCAPRCSKDELASVRTKYLLADVSLGVGIASLAVGAYLLFRPDSDAPKAGRVSFDVRPGTGSLSATYGGVF